MPKTIDNIVSVSPYTCVDVPWQYLTTACTIAIGPVSKKIKPYIFFYCCPIKIGID